MKATLPASLSDPRPRREDFQRGANYRLAWLSENLRGPLAWLAARWCGGAKPSEPRAWRRGVILGPSHIGDVLYNTASLPALRAGLPDCRWTYVAAASGAEALQGNPFLEEIVAIEEPRDAAEWARARRAALAGRDFDVALAYAAGPWKDLLLAARLGIPNRVGYVHKGFSGLVTHPVSIRVPQPFPAYFRDLVLQLTGAGPEAIPSLRPLVYPGAADEEAAGRVAERFGLDGREPVLACAVTSRQASGVWPRDRFVETIRRVRERHRGPLIYFGAKSDAAELEELARRTGGSAHVLAGELSLPALTAFLRRCRVALTTDSGARHLANAAGVPVVFVRNIGFRSEEAGAYGATDHDMAPTDLSLVLPERQAAAFERIAPADVAAEVTRLLGA